MELVISPSLVVVPDGAFVYLCDNRSWAYVVTRMSLGRVSEVIGDASSARQQTEVNLTMISVCDFLKTFVSLF